MKNQGSLDSLLENLKNRLSEIFSKDRRIVAVYLFGSQTDGTAHEKSDLDLGIMIDPESENEFRLDDEIELEIEIEKRLKTDRFDLVVLNKVPLVMQFRIISPAKLIYIGDDTKRCDMEVNIAMKYYDFLPRLKKFNSEYFQALKEEYATND